MTMTAVGRRRPKTIALLAVAMLTAGFTWLAASPSAATSKLSIGDLVTYEDGSPAEGVQVDVYQAASRWTRGQWIGSASTNRDGHYSFDVDRGCYITVAIAPLGAEFDFLGSGRVYDQQFGCAENGPNNDFDSVLYREDTKPEPPPTHPPTTAPPTTQPPTTQPPTTQPPTTQPPTTQPPTTQPPMDPPPYLRECRIYRINQSTMQSFSVELAGVKNLPEDIQVIMLSAEGVELDRRLLGDFRDRSWDPWQKYTRILSTWTVAPNSLDINIRAVSLQSKTSKPSKPVTCDFKAYSPIGLDIDGSGSIERIAGEFGFDFDADGATETVSEWFAPTEGILFDTRIEGPVTGAHLFGDQGGLFSDGFEKLARLDANGDGWVTGAELDGLAIWTDANSNARLDPGEQSALADYAVVGLATDHVDFVSQARLADGSTMVTEDLWFPAATGAAVTDTARVLVLGGAGLAVVGYAAVAARRRRDGLDAELRDLVARESRTTM